MEELALQFHKAMCEICRVSHKNLGYTPTIFLDMLNKYGGVITAKQLLSSGDIQYGFEFLWRHNRLDLTMESYVVKPKYASLFSIDEINEARNRLEAHEYNFADSE